VSISWIPNLTNGWVNIDVQGLKPPDTDVPFLVIGNRYKSSTPDCELFLHQPLQMLLEEAENSPNSHTRVLLRAVLTGITLDSRVTTFIVNHEETLSNYHLYAMVYGGSGSGPTLAIIMWKLGADSQEEGAVVRSAREANG
jgi:hypothetical protein